MNTLNGCRTDPISKAHSKGFKNGSKIRKTAQSVAQPTHKINKAIEL